MLASAVYRLAHPPIVMGSLANLWGYFRSMLQRKPRYGDREFRKFLNRYQWACLIHGKTKATEALKAQQAKVWTANAPQAPADVFIPSPGTPRER
jgi:hypothetical protein